MYKYFIVDGDTTDHGGKVIVPTSLAMIDEHNVATVGSTVHCPACGVDATIVEGKPHTSLDGVAIAEEGGLTSCGARLVSIVQNSTGFDYTIGRTTCTGTDEGDGAESTGRRGR